MPTLTAQLVASIGPRATARLLRDFGGRTLYLPRLSARTKLARDIAIVTLLEVPSARRAEGTCTYGEIAAAFGLSRSQVIRIAQREGLA